MNGFEAGNCGSESQAHAFSATHWSVIQQANDADSELALAAMEQLCRRYWYPLYAYVRRSGCAPEDAQDITQEFFARFLRNNHISQADPARGKFRTVLLTSLKRFMINEWKRAHRQKRGANHVHLYLDQEAAENRYKLEAACDLTPEILYQRRWALTLLESVLEKLRKERSAPEQALLFDELTEALWGGKTTETYAQIAARFGLSESAVKVSVFRLRQRFRELLKEEISRTVSAPGEVEQELVDLMQVLKS